MSRVELVSVYNQPAVSPEPTQDAKDNSADDEEECEIDLETMQPLHPEKCL
eukprot:CAMPEP_0197423454 /NCGR_PEP_ID=MMETSP1170-20131217/21772_1 /TAXON_ID=54406 /ORGANISM="Sarcinochrysis sp, Strain CCMP770" /LENGTH=50 /DNA_ID=CAMNT_0042950877 /DNA_START=125 /DNA_END=277 /DNA_ORIENTATION=+